MKSGGRSSTFTTRADGVTEEFDDGRSYNPSAVRQITQSWVDSHMKDSEDQFTESANVSIFTGTWNVNAKKLDGELNDWLLNEQGGGSQNNGNPPADIYAIGFQEIVDLNAINVALDNRKTQSRAVFWSEKISNCLQNVGNYVMLCDKHLVGLLLCIFVKKDLESNIRDVRTCSTGVGIMGVLGNKGGVGISMNVFDSSICFLSAHLAAHSENVEGRNLDFKNIIERSLFPCEGSPDLRDDSPSDQVVRPRNRAETKVSTDLTILDHEIVFWFGDLNYRIDESSEKNSSHGSHGNFANFNDDNNLDLNKIFELIERKDFSLLKKNDQLNIEREKGNVFQQFNEGDLSFAPTYKYQPNTNHYERRPEKKIRVPAWCDRILYKIKNKKFLGVKQLNYFRSELLPSDHKPVGSYFECRLRVIIKEKENYAYEELMKKLVYTTKKSAPTDSEILPKITIHGLKMKNIAVKYDVTSISKILISNDGEEIAHWRFVTKLDDAKICKKWISVSQQRGLLLPGEMVELTVSILVDKRTSQLLNIGREVLEDVLVLRIENSFDYYAEVSAVLKRSCFGLSLEELVYTPQPVSSTRLPALHTDKKPQFASQPLAIPKELWRLVDVLWTGGALRERNLFLAVGANSTEVASIREALDNNTEFPSCSPHSVVEVLACFLSALSRPLLPPELYPSFEVEEGSMRVWCRKFLEFLPPLNYNSFVFLISFLRDCLAQGNYNRSTSSTLSAYLVNAITPTALEPDISRDEKIRRDQRQVFMQKAVRYLLIATNI